MGIFDRKKDEYSEDEMFEPVTPKEMPAARPEAVQNMLKMKMVKPTRLADAQQIADHLKGGHTVVLNLDGLDDVAARRMLDYIAGVIYAVSGKIERPSDRTFLLTPSGVSIDSDRK